MIRQLQTIARAVLARRKAVRLCRHHGERGRFPEVRFITQIEASCVADRYKRPVAGRDQARTRYFRLRMTNRLEDAPGVPVNGDGLASCRGGRATRWSCRFVLRLGKGHKGVDTFEHQRRERGISEPRRVRHAALDSGLADGSAQFRPQSDTDGGRSDHGARLRYDLAGRLAVITGCCSRRR